MAKKFKIAAEHVRTLINPMGGCYASDRILVDGASVGWMYRERPDSEHDSGWRFFAGDESDEDANDPNRFAFYDVNTICNYDPEIVPLLSTPPPCAFVRIASGFHPEEPPEPE